MHLDRLDADIEDLRDLLVAMDNAGLPGLDRDAWTVFRAKFRLWHDGPTARHSEAKRAASRGVRAGTRLQPETTVRVNASGAKFSINVPLGATAACITRQFPGCGECCPHRANPPFLGAQLDGFFLNTDGSRLTRRPASRSAWPQAPLAHRMVSAQLRGPYPATGSARHSRRGR